MPVYDLDLTVADVVPEGDYLAQITKQEEKKGKESGTPYLNWTFKLVVEGKNIFHITSFKAPFAIKAIMDAADVPYTKQGFDPEAAVGKQVMVHLVVEDSADFGMQNRITKIWKP